MSIKRLWRGIQRCGIATVVAGMFAATLVLSCESPAGPEELETVNAVPPVLDETGLQDAVYGLNKNAVTLVMTASSPDGGVLTYTWYKDTDGDPLTEDDREEVPPDSEDEPEKLTPKTDELGEFKYYCIVTNTLEENGTMGEKIVSITSRTVLITVNNLVNAEIPVITTQPANATYYRNESPTALSVAASASDGGTLSYKWYKDTDGSSSTEDDRTLVGSNAGYTPVTSDVGELKYYCVVTNTITNNGAGGVKSQSTVSGTATITVTNLRNALAPVINQNPAGSSCVSSTTPLELTVAAVTQDEGALSYRWYYNDTDDDNNPEDSDAHPIEGNAGASATLSVSTLEWEGTRWYFVKVTNTIQDGPGIGNTDAYRISETAEVTVTRIPAEAPSITTSWGVGSAASYTWNDTPTALTVSGTSPDSGTITYQWYYNTTDSNAIAGATRLTGATSGSLAVFSPAQWVGERFYFVEVTNTVFDGITKIKSVVSPVMHITVTAINAGQPVITAHPDPSATYAFGATPAALSVTANGNGTLSYQWYYNNVENNKTITSGNVHEISGATSNTYSPPAINWNGTRWYFVKVTNTITDNYDGGVKAKWEFSNTTEINVTTVDAVKPTISGWLINSQPPSPEGTNEITINGSANFTLGAIISNPTSLQSLSYEWVRANGRGIGIAGTTVGSASTLVVSAAASGTFYYYVGVTNTIPDNGDGGTKTSDPGGRDIVVTIQH